MTPGDRNPQESACITRCHITRRTLNTDSFFSIANRQAHQNTSNLRTCQKQTKNAKWLTMSTYVVDVCTNVTKTKTKNRESNVHSLQNLKIHHIF